MERRASRLHVKKVMYARMARSLQSLGRLIQPRPSSTLKMVLPAEAILRLMEATIKFARKAPISQVCTAKNAKNASRDQFAMRMESANLPWTSTLARKERFAKKDSRILARWAPVRRVNILRPALPIACTAPMATTSKVQ